MTTSARAEAVSCDIRAWAAAYTPRSRAEQGLPATAGDLALAELGRLVAAGLARVETVDPPVRSVPRTATHLYDAGRSGGRPAPIPVITTAEVDR